MGRALKELTDHRNDLHAHMPFFALGFLRETIEEESSQTDTFFFFEDTRKKSKLDDFWVKKCPFYFSDNRPALPNKLSLCLSLSLSKSI